MKKRILPLLMASVIGVGTIAGGCGSASSTSTATGSTVTTTDSSADGSGTSTATSSDGTEQRTVPSDRTEVKFWYSGGKSAVKVVEKIVDEFNDSQDKYFVTTATQADYDETFQKLQAAIAGNAAPDCVLLDTDKTRALYEKKLVTALTDYTSKDSDFNQDDYVSVFFDQGVYDDGTVYAIPAYGTTQVMYYNIQAFKDANVDPSSIKTWQDLADAAKKIKDTGKYKYGWEPMWGRDNLIDAAFSNGAKVFSDDGKTVTINSKEWVDVWEAFRKWIHDDQIMAIHSGGQGWEYWYATMDDALKGVAGGYTGSSGDQADLDFSVVQAMGQPAFQDGTQSAPMAEALLLSVLNGSKDKQKQGAYEFMKYFTSADAQTEWTMATGYVPVNQKIEDNETYKDYIAKNPQASVPLEQAKHASVYPVDPTDGAVIDALSTAADAVEIDGTSAQEALDDAQKTAQAALDEALSSK
ncbi:MAG: ABC transporter substrate-binding protein [Chordicoccus sp.]